MGRYTGFKRWTILSLLLAMGVVAQEKDKKIQYPIPQEGWDKIEVALPAIKKGMGEYRVEFTVGFEMETDLCNPYYLIGEWTEHEVKDTDLVYFIASTKGQVVKAMNECPNEKMKSQFVGLKSNSMLHNGGQSLVVYMPEGYQLRYRLWSVEKGWTSTIPRNNVSNTKKNKVVK